MHLYSRDHRPAKLIRKAFHGSRSTIFSFKGVGDGRQGIDFIKEIIYIANLHCENRHSINLCRSFFDNPEALLLDINGLDFYKKYVPYALKF